MILYPAIDLKQGKCVRLYQGKMEQATIFSHTPQRQGEIFAAQGFSWLHLVDLDGAMVGHSVNGGSVRKILDTVCLSIQLGGGIRDMKAVEYWLENGVSRVILGSAAVANRAFVKAACRKFPGQIYLAIDMQNGVVMMEGWRKSGQVDAISLAKSYEDVGVGGIIFTDILRDGAMQGPNFDSTAALLDAVTIPVIASGGLTTLSDLQKLQKIGNGKLQGAVIGRGFYEKTIDPKAALSMAQKG